MISIFEFDTFVLLKAFAGSRLIGRESPEMFGSNSEGFCSTNEIGSSVGEAGAVYRGVNHRLWGKAEIVDQSCQGAEGSIRGSRRAEKTPTAFVKRRGRVSFPVKKRP